MSDWSLLCPQWWRGDTEGPRALTPQVSKQPVTESNGFRLQGPSPLSQEHSRTASLTQGTEGDAGHEDSATLSAGLDQVRAPFLPPAPGSAGGRKPELETVLGPPSTQTGMFVSPPPWALSRQA